MKKTMICLTAFSMMLASVAAFATAANNIGVGQEYFSVATQLTTHGTHCNGTVGCGCPGFAPITNGDVWQQAYCRHCGHKRSVHK